LASIDPPENIKSKDLTLTLSLLTANALAKAIGVPPNRNGSPPSVERASNLSPFSDQDE
jgi:hypothetical protein